MMDQARVLRKMAREAEQKATRSGPRLITVASGKGGVGKTNLCINLGVSIAALGGRVALIDADIGLANVDIALGLSPRHTLQDVVFGRCTMQEAIVVSPDGLHVVAGGSGVQEMAGLEPERLHKFLRELEAMDADYDVVLVDTGAGVGPHVLSFVGSSPETLLVVTPEPSSIADAYALMKAAAARQKAAAWLIAVNMVRTVHEGRQTYERIAAASRRFLGVSPAYLGAVPRDDAVVKAAHMQRPFVAVYPRTAASRAVAAMGEKLHRRPAAEARGVGEFMRRLLGWRR